MDTSGEFPLQDFSRLEGVQSSMLRVKIPETIEKTMFDVRFSARAPALLGNAFHSFGHPHAFEHSILTSALQELAREQPRLSIELTARGGKMMIGEEEFLVRHQKIQGKTLQCLQSIESTAARHQLL